MQLTLRYARRALEAERRPERCVNQPPGAERRYGVPTVTDVLVLDPPDGSSCFVLATADLIWFSNAQARALRARIAEIAGTAPERVSLCASHSHGTPNPDPDFGYGESSSDFADAIAARIEEAVSAALSGVQESVRIAVATRIVEGLAVNRRRVAPVLRGGLGRRAQNLVNPAGPSDPRLTAVLFRRVSDDSPVAVLARYTCHPVADCAGTAGADFPGHLRMRAEAALPAGVPCLFLQGFCGDVRPDLRRKPTGLKGRLIHHLIGPRFRTPEPQDAERLGVALAERLIEALEGACALPGGDDEIWAESHERPVELETGAEGPRALNVTRWRIGPLRVCFVSAEILSRHLPAWDASRPTLAIGYANGMTGYLPGGDDLRYGGYEVDGSRARFGLTARLSETFCRGVSETVRAVAEDDASGRRRRA